jgi:hypothetical protein
MFPEGEAGRPPAVEPGGQVPVPDAPGWHYREFRRDAEDRSHTITLVRDDGVEVEFVVPQYVEQGDELGDIARVVIRARERWEELQGLGA